MPALYDADAALLDITFVQGDDFSMVVDVEGDRSADAFAASLRRLRGQTATAFTITVGSYDSGDDTTPVTVEMPDTTTEDLSPGEHLWDLEWTEAGGSVRTLLRGTVTVVDDVTA